MYLNKQIKIYSSRAVNYEIDNISDGNKKRQVEDLYDALELEKIPYSNAIAKEEQLKFCELLEHRKISTFELPKSCVIIVTANEINKDKINEEIFSLVARI